MIVAYAALSLVNSLVAALGSRRRELALLRLAGATRRQIRAMLEAEALLIGAIGAIAGTAVAIAGLIPLERRHRRLAPALRPGRGSSSRCSS